MADGHGLVLHQPEGLGVALVGPDAGNLIQGIVQPQAPGRAIPEAELSRRGYQVAQRSFRWRSLTPFLRNAKNS
jgi:hypothetical protein